MKVTLLTIGLVLAVVAMLPAAEPKREQPLDAHFLRDYAQTRGFLLGRPVKPTPTPDGKAVLFLRSAARDPKQSLYEFDVASGQTKLLLAPEMLLKGEQETLTPAEKARRERLRVSAGGFTDYQLSEDGQLVLLGLAGRLFLLDRATGKVRELKTGTGTILDPKFSPDGKMVSYVRDHDVYVYDLATDQEQAVTTGGTAHKTHGLAEFVAQEEMGRFSGYWWSPDSKFLAYTEADADGVEVWYVADPANPGQAPHPSYYPRPGKRNVKVRLGIIPATGGETVWIQWDATQYPYLGSVRWDEQGPLTITVQDRLQKEIVLLQVDPASGKTTTLLTEKDPAWVNLRQDVPRWLPNSEGFLWITEQPWGTHLTRHDPNGKVVAELSRDVEEILSVDHSSKMVYFRGRWGNPLGDVVARVSFAPNVKMVDELLTDPDIRGINRAVIGKGGQIYVLTTTTPKYLPRSTVFKADETRLGELPSVAENPAFTPQVEFVNVGRVIPHLSDGAGFWGAIIRPHHFDPKKKYPVIVDVYGGPHHQHVVPAMRNWLIPQWLADQGFIVVAIDNRGTPGRGRDFERAIYQKFGSVPLEDQVAALQALGKKYPELDLERVGIVGWSFGGYLAALAVLKRPNIFKAAVAGAPVTDWEDYDTHYTERYLGLPQDSPEAYKEASLLTYADRLQRPLLLVHGTADDNVYFRHSLKLADALFRASKDFDMLPLPRLTHMVPDPVVMENLWGRIARHFRNHLQVARKE
ncbi:MAG: alpha/beta fold hydrolase [Gemmataceae bacterium]